MEISVGDIVACWLACGAQPALGKEPAVRRGVLALLGLAMLLAAYSVGRASQRDELMLTLQVSSAEHESVEGYFSLGDSTTIMVRPGSPLHRFLIRQRGRKVTLTLTEGAARELSRLDRDPK
jgi:hypothetical protein